VDGGGMKVLMVTPHLPPHQAANALLPALLGEALLARGHEVRFLTFGSGRDGDRVAYVKRRSRRLRATRLPQALEAAETWKKASPLVAEADVVHIHSNTWMNQVAAHVTTRRGKPYVLTHYGTEIWHHDGKDAAFRRLNARAHHVTFYSQALLERGRELGVPCRAASVVYPPVADVFRPQPQARREEVRRRYAPGADLLLLNVKRLHPLADQATLLEAMGRLRQDGSFAGTTLLIAGSGEAEQALREKATRLGLDGCVRFLGLVPNPEVAALQCAADLFVLSSVLEATPTVALEALASGTPVVSTDNPGGLELRDLFGDDVTVVPKQDPGALASAVGSFLAAPRRVGERAARLIEERFRLPGVAERYLDLYREAVAS
jgi:glycosyltransferase involved in cell wall biosynthesis